MVIIDRLPIEKVKVCFVCPACRVVNIKIVAEYEIDPKNYPVVKRDGYGNTVYICEAPCVDCQSNNNGNDETINEKPVYPRKVGG